MGYKERRPVITQGPGLKIKFSNLENIFSVSYSVKIFNEDVHGTQ